MTRRDLPRLALLGALCAVGCGAEQGTFQRPGIDELAGGTAPATFSASVPLRICDLEPGVGLGRPGVALAGFCVDQPPARGCTADVACGSREACVCGVCRAAPCEADDECGPSSRCNFTEHRCQRTCRGDADCAGAGERCDAAEGLCRGACALDGDCQGDESCVEGTCVALGGRTGACSRDADCLDRARCAIVRRPADLREPAWFTAGAGGLFLEWRDGSGGAAIWRAELAAGQLQFVPRRAVIAPGPDDGSRAGAPTVVERLQGLGTPTTSVVFADGNGRLRLAESDPASGGREFTIRAAPLLAPTQPWQQSGLDSPSVVTVSTAATRARLLYFATRDGAALGVARWPDGSAALVAEPAPVLVPADVEDPALFRNVERLAGPCALPMPDPSTQQTAGVRLYFSARGIESADALQFGARVPAVPNDSIAVAQSTDGLQLRRWPWNPVYDRVVQFLDHRSELEPDIEPASGRVVFRAASADGRRSDGLRFGYLVGR